MTPQGGRNIQQSKELRRQVTADEPIGFALGTERETDSHQTGDALEGSNPGLQVDEVRVRHAAHRAHLLLMNGVQGDHTVASSAEGQRPQQDGVDETERSDVRADTQRECRENHQGEPGAAQQDSYRESEVLPQRLDPASPPRFGKSIRRGVPL